MNTGKLLRPLGWLPSSLPVPRLTHWLTTARGWHTQRLAAAAAVAARADDSLIELDARTLCDIGAPPALLARAQRRRQAQRERYDDLRAGGPAGDWQGW
ncbi:MAG: hypothetical protein ABL916_20690 [Burkholderiaceae bacterium]